MVATSNFVNVTGGLLAILMFYFVTFVFQKIQGNDYQAATVSAADLPAYVEQLERHQSIPRMLFLFAAGTTLLVLIAFQRMRPDFLLRTLSFFRNPERRSLRAVGADHMPSYGPLLIVSNAKTLSDWTMIVSVLDRATRFVWRSEAGDDALLKSRTIRGGVGVCLSPDTSVANRETQAFAEKTLNAGDLFGVTVGSSGLLDESAFRTLAVTTPELRILPVYVGERPHQHGEDVPLSRAAIPDEAAPIHAYGSTKKTAEKLETPTSSEDVLTVVVGDARLATNLQEAASAVARLGT